MMTGSGIKTNMNRLSIDWLASQHSLRLSANTKLFTLPQQSLKSVLTLSPSKLKRCFQACAVPDRFSKSSSRISIGSKGSKVDVRKLEVPVESKQGHESPTLPEFKIEVDTTWNHWLSYISDIENTIEDIKSLEKKLKSAVDIEDFRTAAKLQSNLNTHKSKNLTHSVNKRLEQAIQEEDFGTAAKLRDEGLVGLCGWWVARGKDDPVGTLVYIRQDFSRYLGRAFSISDVALACDSPELQILHSFFDNRVEAIYNNSSLVLEIFLKEDTNSSIQHQSCILKTPAPDTERESFEQDEEQHPDTEMVEVHYEYDASGHAKKVTVTRRTNKADSTVQEKEEEQEEDQEEEEGMDYEGNNSFVLNEIPPEGIENDSSVHPLMELRYRTPADIRWWDRNRFVLTSRDETGFSGDANEELEDHVEVIERMLAERSVPEDFNDSNDSTDDVGESKVSKFDAALGKLVLGIIEEMQEKQVQENSVAEQEAMEEITTQNYVAAQADPISLEGEMMFSRLPADTSLTDPFTGFYIGSFGPHGFELLYLSRRYEEHTGKELVEAKKITGDQNVPAGEITFQAYIGQKDKLTCAGKYPEELGINALYNGRGRIAEKGFHDPKWVQGELLCFEPWSNMSGGHDMGFVWAVPNARKFLILLTRITLPQY